MTALDAARPHGAATKSKPTPTSLCPVDSEFLEPFLKEMTRVAARYGADLYEVTFEMSGHVVASGKMDGGDAQ
jgi:hypothetical protein